MGMEHSVANMFMLPLGLICGSHIDSFDINFGDALVYNMIPVSLGNLFAGAICVAMSYSYAFGKLGQTQCGAKDGCSWITKGCNCCTSESTEDAPKAIEVTPKQVEVSAADK
jgi:hypothetical protein